MAFDYTFSRIAEGMKPSPIRELFAMTQRPGMISFAGGLPDPAIFPVAEFAECSDVLRDDGRVVLQYGATEGYRPLVDQIRRRMEQPMGRPVAPDEVLVASGSQQVMDMIARCLIDPGDVVVVEAPTYPGALHTFRGAGARFAIVPCDTDGMSVDLLPQVIEECRRQTGQRPKLIYTITNFSNPSGACLSLDRRRSLAGVAAEYEIPVFEDDPYGELRYHGDPLTTVFKLANGRGVLYASSFSKILAPGVRVAWAVGDPTLIRRMTIAKQGMDLCTSVVTQALVAEYTRRGYLDSHLAKIRTHYAAKAAAMGEAFHRNLPTGALSGLEPEGGFFFWLRLAAGDSTRLFSRAVEEGVAFLPGPAFYPDPGETIGEPVDGKPFARFCFTFAQGNEMAEGARRLSRALLAG